MTTEARDSTPLDNLRLENGAVGTVLFASGVVCIVLGLLRSSFTPEAVLGAAMLLLGLHTLWGARRSDSAP